LRLRASSSQRAVKQKGIVVEIGCPAEACTATVRGTVSVPGAARNYRLRSLTKQIRTGGKAKLKLKFSKRVLKATARALRRHRKVRARVTVTVKDAAGNATTQRRSIRLKR
jgi:ribosome-associated protein YbcJ (S4-like RNA binding protein)